jgi:hypothetical protein
VRLKCIALAEWRSAERAGLSMVRQTALPITLPPRLVSREAAAAYVCMSTIGATGHCREAA